LKTCYSASNLQFAPSVFLSACIAAIVLCVLILLHTKQVYASSHKHTAPLCKD